MDKGSAKRRNTTADWDHPTIIHGEMERAFDGFTDSASPN
jgi:hypothetical protein